MDFEQTQQAYARLKVQLEQGRITAKEFDARVDAMVVTDSSGALWHIGVKTGKWYRFDGQGHLDVFGADRRGRENQFSEDQ